MTASMDDSFIGDEGREIHRTIGTPGEMEGFGRELGALLRVGDLVALAGPLGAGKTTLTRGIGAALNVRGPVTSPTFVLARTHPNLSGGPALVHVDAYRLSSALELDDLDIDFTRSIVVVEWASGMLDGVAESFLEVRIDRPTGTADTGPGEEEPGEEEPGDDEPEDDEPVEPRDVRIRAFGPRWRDAAALR